MTEIHFLRDFDYRAEPYLTIAYLAGMQVEVEDECAEAAIAGGYANYPDFLEDDLIDDAPEDFEAE